jgi:flagellar motility protein MotE (MotC chaperone)
MRKRQKSSWKERIIHGFLLPLAFMATVLLVVLPFLGYDLFAVATSLTKKPIAYVENNLTAEATDQNEEELLKKEIDEKDTEISGLKKQLDEKEIELGKKQSELESLSEEIKSELADKEEREKKLQQLANTYEGMSASKSASIMENLTLNEAALLLDAMGSTEQAAVLGKMNAAVAADLTIALRDLEKADDPELAAMQERVTLLMNAIDREKSSLSTSDVAKDLSEMPEDEAAGILSKMAQSEEEKVVGLSILKKLGDDKRKVLLAEMEESISSSYVADLVN